MALAKSTSYLTSKQQVVYSDTRVVAVKKGDAATMTLMVLNNYGESSAQRSVVMANVGFVAGTTVVELFSCGQVVVDSAGGLAVSGAGEALVSSFLSVLFVWLKLIINKGFLSRFSSSRYWMVRILSLVLNRTFIRLEDP